MRVTSDRQTLILAGETPPRRSGTGVAQLVSDLDASSGDETDSAGGQRVTFISARVDAVVTQGMYTPTQNAQAASHEAFAVNNRVVTSRGSQLPTLSSSSNSTSASMPAIPPELHQAYVVSNRASSAYGASAYARTQDMSDKTVLIDTYA